MKEMARYVFSKYLGRYCIRKGEEREEGEGKVLLIFVLLWKYYNIRLTGSSSVSIVLKTLCIYICSSIKSFLVFFTIEEEGEEEETLQIY